MKQITFIFLLFSFSIQAMAATITAQADRNPVQANESFNLVFEAEGSVDDEPDFSPLLKDFTILNQSQGSSISIINGSYSKTTRWTLSLMANKEGVLTVPSIAFGNDRSPELRMTVKPEQTSAANQVNDLFLELETSTNDTWVQSQIVLTVRLFSANNISQFGISKLTTNNMDVVTEQLGDDKRYQTRRGTTPYLVIERRFALFPQQAGKLIIKPFVGEVEITSSTRSYFDPFSRKSRIKRTKSQSLEIQIAGIPKQFSGKTWLPASELKLAEKWSGDTSRFKAGEPLTRTLSLTARGLTSAQLPEFLSTEIPGVKQYPDQPLLNDHKKDTGITGERQEKMAVIASQPGTFTLPAIEIPWWNTTTGKMETARIAARTIKVEKGIPDQAITPQQTMPSNETDKTVTTETITQSSVPASRFWVWLSLILATGWLTTIAFWWLSTRRKDKHLAITDHPPVARLKQARQALIKACQKNDARACRQALLTWGQLNYDNQPASLSELAKIAGEPLASCINDLNKALYSPAPDHWSAQSLMEIIQTLAPDHASKPGKNNNSLESLYKKTGT